MTIPIIITIHETMEKVSLCMYIPGMQNRNTKNIPNRQNAKDDITCPVNLTVANVFENVTILLKIRTCHINVFPIIHIIKSILQLHNLI